MNQNWIKDENISAWRKQAKKEQDKRREWEKEREVIISKHQTSPRCIVLNYK
jgi:hypothetical protein